MYRIGSKVRTMDRGARVHGRTPDKPEGIGIVSDHYRPHGRHSKSRTPPYYVTFENGDAAWYDADEVELVRDRRSTKVGRSDPYDKERIDEIAHRMLDRYSSPKVAAEMAWHHAMDDWSPREDKPRFVFWRAVRDRIYELAPRRPR